MRSSEPRSSGAPASAAAARPPAHQVHGGRAVVDRAQTDQDGQARVERAAGSGHGGRCYGPRHGDGHVGRWQDALEDFTKESFEAEGKRRDVFRAGQRPRGHRDQRDSRASRPSWPSFGRRVVAAGCTAVLPHLFGDPGRPPTGGYAVRSLGPACISREFSCFALKRTSPITIVAAPAGHIRARAVRRPGRRRRRHVLHRRVRPGDDGRRRDAGPGAQSALTAVPHRQAPQGRRRASPTRTWPGSKRGPRPGSACSGCASPTTPSASSSGSSRSGASWATSSSPSRSTRGRATPTATPRARTRCSRTTWSTSRARRRRAALDQTLAFFRERLGVGTGPGPRPEDLGP